MAERVHCLYRVSTAKQVGHDELNQADIPVQRKACREFADKMGWVIVNEEQETGVSGHKVSANDRDKLQLIKKRAEQGEFDILLVFNLCVGSGYGRCKIANMISSQAMLFGNIFCGHCGGRLTLTTNGTVRHNLKGGTVFRTYMNVTAGLKDQLAAAKREFAKAAKEYESVKDKLYDVIRGRSSLPESVLTEMANEAFLQETRRYSQVTVVPSYRATVSRRVSLAVSSSEKSPPR